MSECVSAVHSEVRSEAVFGSHLCHGCLERVRSQLIDLERLVPLMPEFLTSKGSGGGGARTKAGPRLPVHAEALDVSTSPEWSWLMAAAQEVVSGRRLSGPLESIDGAPGLLLRHLEWWTGAWSPGLVVRHVAGIDRLHRRLRALAGEGRSRGLLCPYCGGRLHAEGLTLTCQECQGSWNPAPDAALPALDVAALLRVPVEVVDEWVSAGSVRLRDGSVVLGDVWRCSS